jgi:hypothetical protein
MLTHDRLRELVFYDPETGNFTWRVKRSRGVKAGAIAGTRNRSHGYVMICLENHRYRAHRLAWFYVHGEWPDGDIDHIDGDRTNNRIGNLRPCCDRLNAGNARRYANNSSGYKGVSWHKGNRAWCAQIRIDGRLKHLGQYDCPKKAHGAYMTAARKVFGEFARAG